MKKRQLRTFADAEAALQPYIPIVKQMTGKDITLERMEPLMTKIGNPETKLKVIHVAGTSGKTSTAYYIAGLLKAAGQTVGLTVSPHIDVVSERLQVNLKSLPEAEFCHVLSEFLSLIQDVEPMPSYFEVLMAMAYWYFAKIGVDYAVIETGFGGLHDASNVCHNTDKVCVLTDIGFDHMHILGHTLPEISLQKAGIMHKGNQAFTFEQPHEVLQTFKRYARKVGAHLGVVDGSSAKHVVDGNRVFEDLPEFQQRNWSLAHATYEYMTKRDHLSQLSTDKLEASMHTYVPGRMDMQKVGSMQIVMDGAHNAQKMSVFVNSFQAKFPGEKVPVLLAMKTGKEHNAVLPQLKLIASKLVITGFTVSQDLPSKPINPYLIAVEAKRVGFTDVVVEPDCLAALGLLIASPAKRGVITGSFYLLASLRPHMLNA